MDQAIEQTGECVYHGSDKPKCDGLLCKPHPCNYLLGLPEIQYEELKKFTIKAATERVVRAR